MGMQPLQLHVVALTTVSVEYGWMKPYNPTVYTDCRMQLQFCYNLSQATGQICSCKCHMQLKTSCIRQLQNDKFLVVNKYMFILHSLTNNSLYPYNMYHLSIYIKRCLIPQIFLKKKPNLFSHSFFADSLVFKKNGTIIYFNPFFSQ